MSIFGKQLQDRIHKDKQLYKQNLRMLGDAVSGKERYYTGGEISSEETIRQVELILQYLKIPVPDKVISLDNLNDQIDMVLEPSGASKRKIELKEDWWKNGDGPLLAVIKETGEVKALLPDVFRGYSYLDIDGRKVKVRSDNKDQFELEAWCFYEPLPPKSMTGKEFIRIMLKHLHKSDVALFILVTVLITLLGTLTPAITTFALKDLVPSGKKILLMSLAIMMIFVAFGTWMMRIVKLSLGNRISSRLDVYAENAIYSRVINLPATFFNGQSAGGLAQKISALNKIPGLVCDILLGCMLPLVASLIYVVQIISIAPVLAAPTMVIYIAEVLILYVTIIQEKNLVRSQLLGSFDTGGLVYSFISGIQKIKISGSEKRAYAKWMESYSGKLRPAYKILFPASIRMPLIAAVNLLGILWLYIIAYRQHLPVAQFAGFSASFGMVISGVGLLAGAGTTLSTIQPVLELCEPILQTVPEGRDGKKNIHQLSGKIEVNKVSFQYEKDSPLVLKDLSLCIKAGEYVAIVGPSGCGKTTLFRLLLGFETPRRGAVLFDDIDVESINKRSLRQHIGTVLQDGKLFTGDIFSNITISAPGMTMDDAWEAAEKAGVADDIRRMPMGMHTFITEGSGGISGGQKQRLLIARALCGNPGILLFDEATSALDNLTQKIVTDSLRNMKCTRIVIAHRLSTIRECDRIIVLDQGQVMEDGTFDELIAKNGIFTRLAKRQMED